MGGWSIILATLLSFYAERLTQGSLPYAKAEKKGATIIYYYIIILRIVYIATGNPIA